MSARHGLHDSHSYAYVGMPAQGSNCFVLPSILGAPNGDASLDNAINFILHELIEAVLSGGEDSFEDECKQVVDV